MDSDGAKHAALEAYLPESALGQAVCQLWGGQEFLG
jgi:hypothetical protein